VQYEKLPQRIGFFIVAMILEIVLLGTAVHFNATFLVVWPAVFGGLAAAGVAMWALRIPGYLLGDEEGENPWLAYLLMSIPPLVAGLIFFWGSVLPLNLACRRSIPYIAAFEPCGDENYAFWRTFWGAIAGGTFLLLAGASVVYVKPAWKFWLGGAIGVILIVLLFLNVHEPAKDGPVVTRPANQRAAVVQTSTGHARSKPAASTKHHSAPRHPRARHSASTHSGG
jgi:hypothetical protein